jgi:hypothetical protein
MEQQIMQKKKVNLRKDAEINLGNILWEILMQWKMVLIFSLLVAICLAGLKYVLDKRAFDTAAQTSEEQSENADSYSDEEIEELGNVLTDAERTDVETAVFNQQKIYTDQNYLDSSILMNIDSQNEHILYLEYYITDSDPEISELLCRSYSNRLSDKEILKVIAEAMGEDIADSDLQKVMGELVTVEYTGTTQSVATASGDGYELSTEVYPVITVSVILPVDTDASKVTEAVNSSMQQISAELSESVGSHSLNVLDNYDKYIINNDLKTKQNNVKNEILNSLDDNAEAVDSFSEDQMKLYQAELVNLKNDLGIEDEEVSSDEETEIDEPGISKKYLAAGFIAGIVLYIVFYMIYMLSNHKVTSGDEIEDVTGYKQFGEYHKYDKKGIQRFIWSRRIYNHRYQKYLDLEETSAFAAERICTMDSLMGDEDHRGLTMVSINNTPASEEFAKSVMKKVSDRGCSIKSVNTNAQQLVMASDDARSFDNVILVVCGGVTGYRELDDLLNIMIEYKIPVKGYLYAE